MVSITLGKTGITVNKNGFGALPIQRVQKKEAVSLLRSAYEGGITFFDTARFYTDSEEKLGEAFHEIRDKLYIATKTAAKTPADFRRDLEISLSLLRCDYIDLYQFHNPAFCPMPDDGTGLYEEMLKAKAEGKIRHIGITNHRLSVAEQAISSGLYETLQFPFNYLCTEKDVEIVRNCLKAEMGFIAMKALSGGLITSARASYAHLAEYSDVLPIWGIQKQKELDEILGFISEPPTMTPEIESIIDHDKKELSGGFCRGCGYCVPTCPAHIQINNCARMSLLLRRSPSELQLTKQAQAMMERIELCIHCGECTRHCPYGLDTPKLLEDNYLDYKEVLAGKPM